MNVNNGEVRLDPADRPAALMDAMEFALDMESQHYDLPADRQALLVKIRAAQRARSGVASLMLDELPAAIFSLRTAIYYDLDMDIYGRRSERAPIESHYLHPALVQLEAFIPEPAV